MPGDLTRDTRTSLARALGNARRLTRRYLSGGHLMTILVSAPYRRRDPRPARVVLHQYGATVEDVAEEIARRAGPGAVLFGGLDRDALAAIGIDPDAVGARIGSSFGPEVLGQVVHREPRPPGLKSGASALMMLRRAHPDIFDDALRAVISKARERDHQGRDGPAAAPDRVERPGPGPAIEDR